MIVLKKNLTIKFLSHIGCKFFLLFYIISSILLCERSNASAIGNPKPYKLSAQQFLDRYGKDDSSRAMIQFYFQKRKAYRTNIFVFAGLSGVSGILFQILIMNATSGGILAGLFLGLILASAIYVFGITALVCGIKLMRFSKRKLYKILQNYSKSKPMPKKMVRQILFKEFLAAEKVNGKS